MPDIPDVSSSPDAAAPAEAAQAAPEVAGAEAVAKGQQKVSFSTMDDLRIHEPELYKAMMEGLGQSIIGAMRRYNDRLKKLMREGRQQR